MNATTLVYAFLAGLLPSLIWLWFWLREDENPEPRTLLTLCFVGGMVAVVAAIFIEKAIADAVSDSTLQYILWAACEESLKFIAVAVIALNSGYNDEPIDAMVYFITVALGFAALENALFILGPLSGGAIAASITTDSMRFIGATLVHLVSSATIGFALGLAFYRGFWSKVAMGIIGLSAAVALHASFNLSIINAGPDDTLKTFAWIWGAVVILIVLFEEVKAVRPKFI